MYDNIDSDASANENGSISQHVTPDFTLQLRLREFNLRRVADEARREYRRVCLLNYLLFGALVVAILFLLLGCGGGGGGGGQ